ncbi:MAG TPA: choice-of-anchor Q domain-containing protein [Ilumatobacteraceae bacterium]|nr:choice-of-anchor Q domain-containing protein [Ilumatobacteraceae bacterium]
MKTTLAHPVSSSSRRLTRACIVGALVSLTGLVLTDNVAHATSFVVTTTADGGLGSLRDAITQANANPGPDTINLPAGTYTLTIAGTNENSNATGDLDITGETTIIGAGSGATIIDANGIDRAIEMHGGPVILQSLTVTNGSVPGSGGGNLSVHQFVDLTVTDSVISNGFALNGGAIGADKGITTITRSEIINNTVDFVPGNGSVGSAIAKGGGDNGTLIIAESLIAGNNAIQGTAAVYVNANATITNSTFSGNAAQNHTILLETYGNVVLAATLTHVTIANNTTSGSILGSGLATNVLAPATMSVTVEGSLLQNNLRGVTPSNCAVKATGAITSGDHNLSDDTSCTSFTQPSDLNNNQSTTLGALADNGGPTRTLALVAGSSAIDAAGDCAATTLTDQRFVSRPKGIACDIGAFEADAAVNTSTTETPTTATPTTDAPGSTLVEPPTSLTQTTLPPIVTMPPFYPDQLPVTGSSHSNGLWLAMLACSLGALLVLTARRRAR